LYYDEQGFLVRNSTMSNQCMLRSTYTPLHISPNYNLASIKGRILALTCNYVQSNTPSVAFYNATTGAMVGLWRGPSSFYVSQTQFLTFLNDGTSLIDVYTGAMFQASRTMQRSTFAGSVTQSVGTPFANLVLQVAPRGNSIWLFASTVGKDSTGICITSPTSYYTQTFPNTFVYTISPTSNDNIFLSFQALPGLHYAALMLGFLPNSNTEIPMVEADCLPWKLPVGIWPSTSTPQVVVIADDGLMGLVDISSVCNFSHCIHPPPPVHPPQDTPTKFPILLVAICGGAALLIISGTIGLIIYCRNRKEQKDYETLNDRQRQYPQYMHPKWQPAARIPEVKYVTTTCTNCNGLGYIKLVAETRRDIAAIKIDCTTCNTEGTITTRVNY